MEKFNGLVTAIIVAVIGAISGGAITLATIEHDVPKIQATNTKQWNEVIENRSRIIKLETMAECKRWYGDGE